MVDPRFGGSKFDGSKVWWIQGSMDPRFGGSKVWWIQGLVDPSCGGSKVRWIQVLVDPSFNGSKVQWIQGLVDPSGSVSQAELPASFRPQEPDVDSLIRNQTGRTPAPPITAGPSSPPVQTSPTSSGLPMSQRLPEVTACGRDSIGGGGSSDSFPK